MTTTIVALSTAIGRSAIAVVRMSGPDAITIANKITKLPSQPNLLKVCTVHTALFDEHAMCVYFSAPHSYTGENMVEFHCHGGTTVPTAVIDALITNGAVMARNGEFSQRAFINGKQNLTNAEGIIEMIDAETASAVKAGANLLENKLGKKIVQLQDVLTDIIGSAEATLDYPEEDLELPTVDSVKVQLQEVTQQIDNIINTSALGKVAKYGIDVAIVGAPNVGKSSLLNALLGTERAIVSGIEGTTRDTLTESVFYKDVKLNFVDTAGLHETDNEVEQEGIRRAKVAADNADVILYVTDSPNAVTPDGWLKPVITLFNKCDLYSVPTLQPNQLAVSATQGTNIEQLKQLLYDTFRAGDISSSDLLITNRRHLDCLVTAKSQLQQALADCNIATLDVVASSLRSAWNTLGEITGTTASEEIINRIYSKFCLGK